MRKLSVAASKNYDILIGNGLLPQLGGYVKALKKIQTVALVSETTVYPLFGQAAEKSLADAGFQVKSFVFPAGEASKCADTYLKLLTFLARNHLTRTDAIVALGGGVVGDLAGFAAATYLRGIRFVQVPTTLLAAVDSSVGGKVAVDLPQGKNLVGAFYQPKLVVLDPDTLRTLSDQVWRDGLGEVVKYGCIGDEALFELLEDCAAGGREALMAHMNEVLLHCLKAKAKVVEEDEHDTGARMTLNFGHTLGHAVEAVQQYNGLRHGEAVALGMAVITRMSEARGMTAPGTSARLEKLLTALGLPTHLEGVAPEKLLAPMHMDKKNLGKTLRIILLKQIGKCFIENASVGWFEGVGAFL